jgi:hypothetical protein
MKDSPVKLSRIYVQKSIFVFEGLGFLLAVLTLWVTEYLDPPFSATQVIIESIVIILLGCFTVNLTRRLIHRIKYLEGFLVMCSSCKSVRIDDRWVRIENVITDNSELQLSHSLCPPCTEKLYGKFLAKS